MCKLIRMALGVCWVVVASQPTYADKHEKWVEARSQNFIVVSNAGEKQARKTDVQFEQIRAVFRENLLVAKNHPSQVITIIAVKDENSMRELMPEFWAKGHAHPAGVFFRALDAEDAPKNGDGPQASPSKNSDKEKRGPGSSVEAEGEVRDVNCTGAEMLLTLTVGNRQIKLHASNYSQLTYYDDNSNPLNKGFLPCAELKGRNVAVVYAAVEQSRYDGDIQSIELEK